MVLFGYRKAKSTPDEIAGVFLSEFVANDDLDPSNELDLSPEQQQRYASKCKLYRLALVIVTLMNEERNDPKVLLVRESIESKVFCFPDDQSHLLLSQIQSSMSDLQKLLFADGNPKELSWARSWFDSIGIDAINPVDLTLFASSWMDQYIAVAKSLREFKIV